MVAIASQFWIHRQDCGNTPVHIVAIINVIANNVTAELQITEYTILTLLPTPCPNHMTHPAKMARNAYPNSH